MIQSGLIKCKAPIKTIILIFGCLHSCWYTLPAQVIIPAGFREKEFTHNQNVIPYRIYTPESKNSSEKFPLIVALHGAENFASPRDKFLSRAGAFALAWVQPAIQESHPCYILAPHIYNDLWSSNQDYSNWTDEKPRDLIIQLINLLLATEKVDPNRIYLTGHSMGGVAALLMPAYMKDRFAAIVPFSSAIGDDIILEEIEKNNYPNNTSIWTFHHTAEPNDIFIRNIYNKLTSAGFETYYTHSFGNEVFNLSIQQVENLVNQHQRYFYTEYTYTCSNSVYEDIDCHMSVMGRATRDTLLAKWLFKQYKIDPEAIIITSVSPENSHQITWQAKNSQDTIEIWFKANETSGWSLIHKMNSQNNSLILSSLIPENAITNSSKVKLTVLTREKFVYGIAQANVNQTVTGIPDKETKPFVVYPNPARGMVFIKTSEELSCKTLRYSITSLTGSVVRDGEIFKGSIDISELSAGIYLIIIKSCSGAHKQKLVILD